MGEAVQSFQIDPMSARAFEVAAGRVLRITDVDGGQPGDLVAFNVRDLSERFSQSRTRVENAATRITTGGSLWSNLPFPNVMMTVVEDTYGLHDLLYKPCCRFALRKRFGCDRDGCLENLARAIEGRGLSVLDVPDPLSLFFRTELDPSGRIKLGRHDSKPGDRIDLRAEMDCLAAVSTCSVPIPGRRNSAYRVEIA